MRERIWRANNLNIWARISNRMPHDLVSTSHYSLEGRVHQLVLRTGLNDAVHKTAGVATHLWTPRK